VFRVRPWNPFLSFGISVRLRSLRLFRVLREYVDVGEFGAKELPPQLSELMAAARKRLN